MYQVYVKKVALFEYEVEKVIRLDARVNAPFFDFFFLKSRFFEKKWRIYQPLGIEPVVQ